jgi:hypothetical protein
MNVAVANAEPPSDEQSHSLERPRRRDKAVRGRALDRTRLQARQLLGPEPGGAPCLVHRSKRVQAFGFEHPVPAVRGLTRRPDHYADLGRRVPCLQPPPGAHPAPGSRIQFALGLRVQIPLSYRHRNNAWRRILLSRAYVILNKTVDVGHDNDISMTKKTGTLLVAVPLELARAARTRCRAER